MPQALLQSLVDSFSTLKHLKRAAAAQGLCCRSAVAAVVTGQPYKGFSGACKVRVQISNSCMWCGSLYTPSGTALPVAAVCCLWFISAAGQQQLLLPHLLLPVYNHDRLWSMKHVAVLLWCL
jgi:hypothetical protein